MQYLTMSKDMTLTQLSRIVGERNVDEVLNANSLTRSVNIGKAFQDQVNTALAGNTPDKQKKINILNQFVGDSDIYEKAALGTGDDWKTLAQYNCFTDAVRLPDDLKVPPSVGIIGNGQPVATDVYNACIESILDSETGEVDPLIFAEYNAAYTGGGYGVSGNGTRSAHTPFQWFNLPWGEICLYSSLEDVLLYFPVYPEEFEDGVSANYEEMGEMLYQYEPWKVYKSSGPREMSFTFKFHRDMWTGDHRDGNANNLIRGCEANCYPEYNGSLVNVSQVTLYVHGQNYITGVMTDCKTSWERPIGTDGFPLVCTLSFTITEISPEPLNYTTVRNKGLIQ